MAIVWKGALSFGLITIPVELYTAVSAHALGFTLLHDKCHTPLEYERWCPHCEKEVVWANVVKGLKVKDRYIVLDKETLKKLKPEKLNLISIVHCVDKDAVAPLYFNQHYYCAPSGTVEPKAYFLFMEALHALNKMAIATIIFKEREHVCLIQPYQGIFLLTTLHYAYEIRDIKKVQRVATRTINAQELALAKQFVTQLSRKKFDITQFKDTFVEKLIAHIKQLQKKPATKKAPHKAIKKPQTTSSLIGLLKASVEKPIARARAR